MFFILFLFLRIKWSLLFLIKLLLHLLKFPLLFREDMIHILVFKFELIKLLNTVMHNRLYVFDFLVYFIIDINFIHFFFTEFDHQSCIFAWPFIIESYWMQVDCLVKHNILYFSFCFTCQISQFVVMHEEKLKFDSIVLHEFDIIIPVCRLFTCYFDERTVGANRKTVFDKYECIAHEDFRVFFFANNSHCRNCHESICESVIYY